MNITVRDAAPKDYEAILRLNLNDEKMLSPLTRELIEKMSEITDVFQVAEADGKVAAFQMLYRENTDYWSDNYIWFNERFDRFIYMDRIVVDEKFRRLGIGTLLYEEVFKRAKASQVPLVTCEIDIKPEYNLKSMKFHEGLGFHEIGTKPYGQNVTVSLQVRDIPL